ncbi:unnamed protein product [Chironomus riparius]|uniref:F-box domain-containing protein n=1 Tax=Chironomus riparius TaxID=315576 RepID=A0A9P0IXU3_9DIPT|nr:unnamed protein product [Chironomus riparius]
MKTKEVMAPKKDEITWKSITNNIVKAIKNKRYDPVELLPKNVVDKIFDYIKGKELMTVSLVNHRWYNFIGKSERHMSKVEIRIVEPRTGRLPLFTMRDATFMTQNRRKYQNISLISLEFGLRTQHKLLLANFQWRIVRLICHGFKTQIDLNNFLGMIEPYVEEIVLRSICIKKDILHTLEQNFTFPRLMKLSIRNCSAYVYNGPFNGVTNLYSLNIGTEYSSKYSPGKHKGTLRNQGIQNIMLNNHYLDELELFLSQEDFDAIYMNERFLRNIRFSLYSLSVGCFIQQDNEGINIVQINNFIRFLESQKYLVELNLEKWLGILVLECSVNDMQLRGLTITTFEQFGQHNDSVDHLSLQRNQTIEHLRIWTQNNSVVKEIVNPSGHRSMQY